MITRTIDVEFNDDDLWSLGKLIKELENIDFGDDCNVQFDFCGFVPAKIDSWRGDYSELAIGYKSEDSKLAADFLADLCECLNKTYEGYKGGLYTMNKDTPMWVDSWGEYTRTGVVGLHVDSIEGKAYAVYLQTALIEG